MVHNIFSPVHGSMQSITQKLEHINTFKRPQRNEMKWNSQMIWLRTVSISPEHSQSFIVWTRDNNDSDRPAIICRAPENKLKILHTINEFNGVSDVSFARSSVSPHSLVGFAFLFGQKLNFTLVPSSIFHINVYSYTYTEFIAIRHALIPVVKFGVCYSSFNCHRLLPSSLFPLRSLYAILRQLNAASSKYFPFAFRIRMKWFRYSFITAGAVLAVAKHKQPEIRTRTNHTFFEE